MSRKKKTNEEEFDFAEVMKATLLSSVVSILLVGIILLLLSLLMSFYDVPQVVLSISILFLTVLLGFFCGYLCCKTGAEKGDFCRCYLWNRPVGYDIVCRFMCLW